MLLMSSDKSLQTGKTLLVLLYITVEPLNNGHIGLDHFVHYTSFRGKNVCRLVHWKVSFIR